ASPSPPLCPYTTLFRSGSDDLLDGFVGLRRFVQAAAQQGDAAPFEIGVAGGFGDAIQRSPAAHQASGAVRGRGERLAHTTSAHRSEEHTSALQSLTKLV